MEFVVIIIPNTDSCFSLYSDYTGTNKRINTTDTIITLVITVNVSYPLDFVSKLLKFDSNKRRELKRKSGNNII